jgi:hypothetical protein
MKLSERLRSIIPIPESLADVSEGWEGVAEAALYCAHRTSTF